MIEDIPGDAAAEKLSVISEPAEEEEEDAVLSGGLTVVSADEDTDEALEVGVDETPDEEALEVALPELLVSRENGGV